MSQIAEGWKRVEPPEERARRAEGVRAVPTKNKASRMLLEAFLASGDECWAKEFPAEAGCRSRSASVEASRLGTIARALSMPVRIRKRGRALYLVRM